MLLALAFACSCSKKDGPASEPGPPARKTGSPTPVGTPDGSHVARASIGATGGTLTSADGQLTVTIPPGAFTANQQVSIERITNHNPLRIGQGYRLQPEGLTFAKAVTLTFRYLSTDTVAYPIEAAGIAYQTGDGVWMAVPRAQTDANARTVTVPTTHFSDWSQYTPVRIVVRQPALAPNAATSVSVTVADDFLAPLDRETPIPADLPADPRFIKSWKLSGAGRLEGEGPVIRYVAPPTIATPPQSVATVTAEVYQLLGQPATYKLNAHVRTVEGFLKLRINGGDEITLKALPVVKASGDFWQLATTGAPGSTGMVITWPFGVGTHGFSILPRLDKAVVSLVYNGDNYGHTYIASGNEMHASPGFVKITSMGAIDGFVTGTFSVEKAGRYPTLKNTIILEGSFTTTKVAH